VLFTCNEFANWGLINTNWIHLKKLVTVLSETDDFKKITAMRIQNFRKYRINALNGSHGKILTKGTDMRSLISRNQKLIESTMEDCVDKDIFLKTWSDNSNWAHDLLPWPVNNKEIDNQI
jgi:hypothetical protein